MSNFVRLFEKEMKCVSFAYEDELPKEWKRDCKDCTSLDFLSSCFSDTQVSNFKNLTHLRIARASGAIEEFELRDLPNLLAADVSMLDKLRVLRVNKCNKLRALDCSFSQKLAVIEGKLDKLEYLSCDYCAVEKCPKMPSLLYLDAGGGSNSFDFSSSTKLEFLTLSYEGSTACISKLTKLFKKLRIFECSHRSIIFDSIQKGSCLEFLILNSCEIIDENKLSENFYISINGEQNHKFPTGIKTFNYVNAQKLLYGKWGIPNVDLRPIDRVEKPIFYKPDGCKDIEPYIQGAIYGSAVMDMIGVGVEFLPKAIAEIYTIQPLSMNWSHPRITIHTGSFIRGTPTDDTSQNILIMRSLFKSNSSNEPFEADGKTKFMAGKVKVDLGDFGKRLIDWKNNGFKEHKHNGGLGMGKTVKTVLSHQNFLSNPISVSKEIWELSGKSIASNGAVMRTASCGCLCYWDENTVIQVATKMAQITHFDPRCVFSAVAISLLVSRILQYHAGLIETYDIDQTIETAISNVEGAENYREEILKYSRFEKIEDLKLSEPASIGYTLKAYGSAIWALRYCNSFAEALEKVIREGGDADTNGAVVGAVIGAKYGFYKIPKEFIEYMFDFSWMNRELKSFLSLMKY